MGVGASTMKGDSGEVAPLLNRGGEGESGASQEQASYGDGVRALEPHSNFFEPLDLQIPQMEIREDRVFAFGLPEVLDPQVRVRYEHALFRLFFQRVLFVRGEDGEPSTFGTIMASEDPLLRKIAERAISFADHLMRYVRATYGIEPKQFLDAAVKYTESCEETRKAGSTLAFLKCCLSIEGAAPAEQKRAHASSLIGRSLAEVGYLSAPSLGDAFAKTALAYSQSALYVLTDGITSFDQTANETILRLNYLHFGMAYCCLKHHQAILSQSKDHGDRVLAAKAAAKIDGLRMRLDPENEGVMPAERQLPALETIAAYGDVQDVCNGAEVLESLLPVDARATIILVDLKARYAKSGELSGLVEALADIGNPPRKVMEYLRR